jgi:hypothetical protein
LRIERSARLAVRVMRAATRPTSETHRWPPNSRSVAPARPRPPHSGRAGTAMKGRRAQPPFQIRLARWAFGGVSDAWRRQPA